jgi:hypothetical protein
MTEIPIYNTEGTQVNSIVLTEDVQYVNGRVSKGSEYYYKGVGVPYELHHVFPEDMTGDYEFIESSDVFYLGNMVKKKKYEGKFGIFQEKHQPHFTDWIGACGIKELNIFENLYDENRFEYNAIEAIEYVTIDETSQQYYLKVQYPGGRTEYLDNPSHIELRELLDYMIQSHWNFPWDKNSISDLTIGAKVTDVADLFYSKEITHKIGSIYSILYSLAGGNYNEYLDFCRFNNLRHTNQMGFVFNTLSLLSMNGVDVKHFYTGSPLDVYKNVVRNYLVIGKNCGFCGVGSCKGRTDSNQSFGEEIRQTYIQQIENTFNMA